MARLEMQILRAPLSKERESADVKSMLIAFVRTASLESSRSRRCLVWSDRRFSRGREAEALDCSRYRDVLVGRIQDSLPCFETYRNDGRDKKRILSSSFRIR